MDIVDLSSFSAQLPIKEPAQFFLPFNVLSKNWGCLRG